MTVDSEIFSISTLNTIEYGPLTLNIKPHLDPYKNKASMGTYKGTYE